MSRALASIVFMLVAAALLAPARARGSRLNLKLDQVTCQEAALALQRASGVAIEIQPWEYSDIPGAVDPPLVPLAERASFDWSASTFAEAFRQLADRYRLRPQPQRGGFALVQEGFQGPLPVYGTGSSTQRNGMRLQVRGVGVSGATGGQAAGDRLSLRLHGIGPAERTAMVTSVENLVARDDRGGILRVDARFPGVEVQHTYPDEWTAPVQFEGLQPGATKLAWLEGDVLATSVQSPHTLEAPLPLPKGGIQRPAGEGRVEFVALSPPARKLVPGSRNLAGPTLVLRLHGLDLPRLVHPNGYAGTPGPLLIGASGRTYAPPGISSQGVQQEGERVWDVTCTYPAIDEPLTGLRFEFGERGEPQKLFTFHIPEVPLPNPYRGADTLYYGALVERDFGRSSRDFAAPGGVLVSPVQIGERPAPPSFLSIGLAPADGSGRTEWHQVEVSTAPAQLAGVRPGAYRILRLYRPREHGSVEMPRWWRNGETVVQVEAGKETQLPPLHMPLQGEPVVATARPEWRPKHDRMAARVVDLYTHYVRSRELSTPPRVESRASLELNLSGTGAGVGSELVATLGNVVGRDDRGNVLTRQSGGKLTAIPQQGGFQWRQQITLNAPHPHATELSWLEGDLLAHGTPYPLEAEFPAAVPREGAARDFGGIRCEVDSLTSALLPAASGAPAGTEYLLRGR
ncbi:MAG TPA: hypothetical protein VK689_10140, partial [Armatimonadota bacterium]|nr:hypothetical protein [Armatimonadota bacterium]